MNFKFTKWKVIGTLIISILIYLLFVFSNVNFSANQKCEIAGTCPSGIDFTSLIAIIVFLASLVFIYIIWSLFQKKGGFIKKKR